MTRQFLTKFECSNCRCLTTAETAFSRWTRERQDLDSQAESLVVCDVDYVVHKYRVERKREFQCFMWLEVKTHGAEPTAAQADTILLINQLLKNRRPTPYKDLPLQVAGAISKAYSFINKRYVYLRAFGAYVLQFEKTGPDDGWIKWGPKRTEITPDELAALLRFDLDPDTLQPMDWRKHHADNQLKLAI